MSPEELEKASDIAHDLLDSRLVMVTGKGGTGKTTYAAAIAMLAAARGKRTLLAEVDNQRPALTPIFGEEPTYEPVEVRPNLDICNVTWNEALKVFLRRLVPSKRVVSLILDSSAVQRFLDFTPGSQEIVTLSALGEHAADYDLVVVDMPASGHAFSLLDITRSALGLFRSGPVRQRAQELRQLLSRRTTRMVFVGLPEEMVVNETIETYRKMEDFELVSRPPAVFLNRATMPSLTDPERDLLARLGRAELDPLQEEFVRAGRWEDALEQATAHSAERLTEALEQPPILVPPAPPGGIPAKVVESVAAHLGRLVGVARRDLKLDGVDLPAPPVEHLGEPVATMDSWLQRTNLVVCVGAGGVGKTTTAATLGLSGALRGRRAMVLTIDPARRLANSLGLSAIGNEETRIDLSHLDAPGELWAMMLDSKSTFDGLIERVAGDEETRQRILGNHVYRHMADTFAGSQDYMATEKLYDIVTSDKYDLVILDTPPVKNALDFLESPGRLINFLDERVQKWFTQPESGFSRRWMMGTSAVVYKLLGAVFGEDFLHDLTVFFRDFSGLYAGFVERHATIMGLFTDEHTQFVTVCAPTESSLDVATFFQEELAERDLPRGGIIVNQVHTCEGDHHDARAVIGALATELGAELPEAVINGVLARLGMAHRRLHALTVAEASLTAQVRKAGRGGGFYQEVPRLEGNVHDLDALATVSRAIFAPVRTL